MKCLLALALAVACLNGITPLAVYSDNFLKPELDEPRRAVQHIVVKEAVKIVVKRNTELINTTTTPGVTSSSPSTAQTPAQKTNINSEQERRIAELEKLVNANNPPANGDGYNYNNVIAILGGGGLLSVAKAIQTVYVTMKKKKKKKGKKQDGESGSDSEEDAPTRTVAVKIEMVHASQTETATSKTDVPKINIHHAIS